MREFDLIDFCSNNHTDSISNANSRISSPRRSPSQLSLTQWSSPLPSHSHQSPSSSRLKDSSILGSGIVTGSVGNLTIYPVSKDTSQNKTPDNDDSATESESESVVANFIAEIKQRKRLSITGPGSGNPPGSTKPVMQDVLSEYENTLYLSISFSLPLLGLILCHLKLLHKTHKRFIWPEPHLQNLHFPAWTRTNPFPRLSRTFSTMFDDDEDGYPVYIPLRFAAVEFEIYYTKF